MTRKKTGPRSEMGRLREAIEGYGEQMILWQQWCDDDQHPRDQCNAAGAVATRKLNAIVERMRKLIAKGRVSSRVERGEK